MTYPTTPSIDIGLSSFTVVMQDQMLKYATRGAMKTTIDPPLNAEAGDIILFSPPTMQIGHYRDKKLLRVIDLN